MQNEMLIMTGSGYNKNCVLSLDGIKNFCCLYVSIMGVTCCYKTTSYFAFIDDKQCCKENITFYLFVA